MKNAEVVLQGQIARLGDCPYFMYGGNMNKKDLVLIKKILIQKKAEFLNKVNSVQKEITNNTGEDVGDEIDAAIQNVEKEISFELAANDKIASDEISDALAKIEKGNYGKCECCGQDIAIERLKAIPWGRYCIQCQEEAEKPVR